MIYKLPLLVKWIISLLLMAAISQNFRLMSSVIIPCLIFTVIRNTRYVRKKNALVPRAFYILFYALYSVVLDIKGFSLRLIASARQRRYAIFAEFYEHIHAPCLGIPNYFDTLLYACFIGGEKVVAKDAIFTLLCLLGAVYFGQIRGIKRKWKNYISSNAV